MREEGTISNTKDDLSRDPAANTILYAIELLDVTEVVISGGFGLVAKILRSLIER